MPFSYTTGNPANLTGGATASMNDIQGPFTDIKTWLTGANIDDTGLVSPNNAMWRPVLAVNGPIFLISSSLFYFSTNGPVQSAGGGAQTAQGIWLPPASSDIAVAGKTARMRLRVSYVTNAVACGITPTWGLYPITASAGSGTGTLILTLGTVVTGSTAANGSPPANSNGSATSAGFDFSTLSASTAYILGVTGNSGQAATSLIMSQAILEMRHT